MGTEGKGWSCCTGTRNMLLVTLAVLDPYYAGYPICLIEAHTQYVPDRQTFTGGRERAVWEHWSRGQQRTSKTPETASPPLYCLLKEFMKMNVIVPTVWGYPSCMPLSLSIPAFSVACKQNSLWFCCLGFLGGMRGDLHPQFHSVLSNTLYYSPLQYYLTW